jgi:alanine racemase
MQASRCWAEISRAALVHNARAARDRIGSAELLAVVKANAYGHGMAGVAETLRDEAKIFGVANLEEAVALREKLDHTVMILGPALPDERRLIIERGFIPPISTFEEAVEFDRLAKGRRAPICFVIDTGMGRLGTCAAEAAEVAVKIASLPNLSVHSVASHLPVSDEDKEFTRAELTLFSEIVKNLRQKISGNWKAHILLSAGILAYSDRSFDLVRAGLMLYGISPLPEMQSLLRPVMTWKTRIGIVRELPRGSSISYGRTFVAPHPMKVATLTAGYADGYPRHLSNRGTNVLVGGRRCALLGRITMDLIVVDVSRLPQAQAGDEVVLMGSQDGEEISCAELAQKAETIPWEITARVGQRVPRIFVS